MMDYGVGDWVICVELAGTGKADRPIKPGTKLAVRELMPKGFNITPHHFLTEDGVFFHAHRNGSITGTSVEAPYPARAFRLFDPPRNEDDNLAIVRKALEDMRASVAR